MKKTRHLAPGDVIRFADMRDRVDRIDLPEDPRCVQATLHITRFTRSHRKTFINSGLDALHAVEIPDSPPSFPSP